MVTAGIYKLIMWYKEYKQVKSAEIGYDDTSTFKLVLFIILYYFSAGLAGFIFMYKYYKHLLNACQNRFGVKISPQSPFLYAIIMYIPFFSFYYNAKKHNEFVVIYNEEMKKSLYGYSTNQTDYLSNATYNNNGEYIQNGYYDNQCSFYDNQGGYYDNQGYQDNGGFYDNQGAYPANDSFYDTETDVAPVTNKATGRIIGMSGDYSGYPFPIGPGEQIVIGRDPSVSNIIIDGKYTTVSKKQCTISYDTMSGLYTVIDHSSNNSTSVNGNSLQPNTPIQLTGDTIIKIGNGENSFRLD